MADGVATIRSGHRTWLKWHRGRRELRDIPFTGERILEGMRLGASVEVDLVKHADGGFAILHDFILDHDTTGSGRVAHASAATLRALHLRDAEGQPTKHRLMLLEDLAQLIAGGEGISPEAILQLDLKEDAPALTDAVAESFARSVGPVARHFILSGGDAQAVARLSAALPELVVGHDPCSEESIAAVLATGDFNGFVASAVAAAPRARIIYLEYRLVLAAAGHGFDLVAAFHDAGRAVDAYTLEAATPENAAIARQLLDLEVDQITTDDPVALEALLETA